MTTESLVLTAALLFVIQAPLSRWLKAHHPNREPGRLTLAGLIALVGGIFYLNQFREGLIDARVQALLTQGEIMASAVAASATSGTSSIQIDPEKLLEQQATEDEAPSDDAMQSLDFPINPERVAPLLRRVVTPTKLRARIYDRDGNLILDSRSLYFGSDIVRRLTPGPPKERGSARRIVRRYGAAAVMLVLLGIDVALEMRQMHISYATFIAGTIAGILVSLAERAWPRPSP